MKFYDDRSSHCSVRDFPQRIQQNVSSVVTVRTSVGQLGVYVSRRGKSVIIERKSTYRRETYTYVRAS